jgi:hypothetical protein
LLHGNRELIEKWLAGEVRFPGIKENAATLAALEIPGHRQEVAQSYASRHPDRLTASTTCWPSWNSCPQDHRSHGQPGVSFAENVSGMG